MGTRATAQEEAAFEAFLRGTSHLMALLDLDGSVRWVSPSVETLLGWTQEEFCAQHPIVLIHPEDAAFVTELMAMASAEERDGWLENDDARLAVDVRVKHRDGRWVTMEVMGNNLLGAPGINGRMVVCRDVTVRRAMDDALTALADTVTYEEVVGRILDFLELTVSATASGVWWPGSRPSWTTRHVPAALLVDEGPWRALPSDGSHVIIEDLKEAVADGRLDSDLVRNAIDAGFSACWLVPVPRPPVGDTWVVRPQPTAWTAPTGALVIWSRQGCPPLIGQGVAMNRAAAMIFLAMTHHQVEQERASQLDRQRLQNEQLAEINAMRTDLFLTMSHDLRTPLASISGAADMLSEEGSGIDPEDRTTYLEIIGHNTSRMLHMVDDLLLLAKLDAEGLRPAHDDVDLAAVTTAAVEDVRPAARAKGVDLSLEVSGGPSLRGDSDQLRHLVDNLVSNAVKFTPAGGQISVQTCPSEDGWELVVCDDGIGIPPAEQAQIFDRFARGSNARAAHIAGSGLGLVIARAVARGHGGDITVQSAEGEGARFLVTLRCSEESAAIG